MSAPSRRRRRRSSRTASSRAPSAPEYVFDRSAVPSAQDTLLVQRDALSACLEAALYARKAAQRAGDLEAARRYDHVLQGLRQALGRQVRPINVRTSGAERLEAAAFPPA